MSISDKNSTLPLRDYPTDLPGADENEAQRNLGTPTERTSEDPEEDGLALTEFVETVQRSNDPELNEVVQRLFNLELQRPLSAPPAEKPAAKQRRREPEKTETGIQDLDLSALAHILSFLGPQSQGRAARVSQGFRDAMRLQRILNLTPLYNPKFTPLLSLFGITLPAPNSSSSDVTTACKTLHAEALNILEGIKESQVLSDEEKAPFLAMNHQNIVQDPERLFTLLHTAHEISLVAPFLNVQNDGPELSDLTTLTKKAKAVRNHLEENRDRHTQLICSGVGMLCFPRDLCSLPNLQALYLSENRLTILPPEIGQLAQLRQLYAGNNQLSSLPPEIGQLGQLQTLLVDNNQLSSLPPEIMRFAQRIQIYLSHNLFAGTPKSTENILFF